MMLRFAAISGIVAAAIWLTATAKRVNRELEAARGALLGDFDRERASLTRKERNIVKRVEPWLRRAAKGYEGDWIADEIQHEGGLSKVLTRSMVYVRGPERSFHNLASIQAVARDSTTDAFVFCLLEKPKAREERVLRRLALLAAARGEKMQRGTANVHRLGAAVIGLPLLEPPWRKRVVEAENQLRIDKLRKAFDLAPLKVASAAAKAHLLLYVIDEPGGRSAPVELDGERPHQVRVGIVDLIDDKPLLRLRRPVDPGWLSDRTRSEFARGVDSCTLAFDVHAAVQPEPTVDK